MDAILEVPGAVLVLLGFGPGEVGTEAWPQRRPIAGASPARRPAARSCSTWTASADVLGDGDPAHVDEPPSSRRRRSCWEALAAGVPVVASDLPGMAEVVRETGAGDLCDPTSPASIATRCVMSWRQRPNEREALRGLALRAAHERYNWETQAVTLLGLYAGLVAAMGDGHRQGA